MPVRLTASTPETARDAAMTTAAMSWTRVSLVMGLRLLASLLTRVGRQFAPAEDQDAHGIEDGRAEAQDEHAPGDVAPREFQAVDQARGGTQVGVELEKVAHARGDAVDDPVEDDGLAFACL